MKKIGFIGVGIMGKSMVRNLMKAGYELHIYARTKAKVEDVIGEGAIFHETISECVKDCEAVITIVGFPQDVEEVYFDSGNILDSAKKGAYLIDMTTTSPQIAEKLYEEGTKRGFHVLDAPVTGGVAMARQSLWCVTLSPYAPRMMNGIAYPTSPTISPKNMGRKIAIRMEGSIS